MSGCADYFAADENESSQYIRDIVETLNIPKSTSTKIASREPKADFDVLEIAGQKVDARLLLSCHGVERSQIKQSHHFPRFSSIFGTFLGVLFFSIELWNRLSDLA